MTYKRKLFLTDVGLLQPNDIPTDDDFSVEIKNIAKTSIAKTYLIKA